MLDDTSRAVTTAGRSQGPGPGPGSGSGWSRGQGTGILDRDLDRGTGVDDKWCDAGQLGTELGCGHERGQGGGESPNDTCAPLPGEKCIAGNAVKPAMFGEMLTEWGM